MFASPDEFRKVLTEKLQLKDDDLIDSLVENMDAVKELTRAEWARVEEERNDWGAAFAA
jgi:hypothetical protein